MIFVARPSPPETIAGLAARLIDKLLAAGWDASGCLGATVTALGGALFTGWAWSTVARAGASDGTDAIAALGGAIVTLWLGSILVRRRR